MQLILRSLLMAVVLLAGYGGLVSLNPGGITIPQGINQDNTIKMQNFVYARANQYPTVILGSSLAAKLRAKALPDNVYNLAFRGQSVYEGFEIMKRSNQVPRLILVEMDVLDRAPDWGTVDNLFNPAMHPLRRLFPALQERHQALNQAFSLGFLLLDRFRPSAAEHIREKLGVKGHQPADTTRQAVVTGEGQALAATQHAVEEVLEGTRTEYNKLPARVVFDGNLVLLQKYVRYFTERGSRIVFFEMPIDPVACHGAKMDYIRQRLEAVYPPGEFTYLPRPDCQAYTTTDGLHLSDPSALRYTQVLDHLLESTKM